jgi:hypothetical protein
MASRDGVARSHLTVPQNGACRQAKARTIAKNFRRKEKFARRPPGQRSGRILSSGADTRSRWSREDIRLTDLR